MSPYVCVWSVADVSVLRTFGADGSIARMVCAVCFFDDSSHVVAVGGDDRHTLRVYDLNAEAIDASAVITAPCKSGVQPPAVTGAFAAPRDTARRFGNDHLVVTVGKGHLAFWLIDLPKARSRATRNLGDAPGYEFVKRLPTYSPHPAPGATHAVAFVHRDDAVVTGASDGKVYIWRDFKVVSLFAAHAENRPCRALAHADGYLFTGGGDGLVKRWHLDKGRYRVVGSHRPLSPHDAGKGVAGEEASGEAFSVPCGGGNIGQSGGAASGGEPPVKRPPVRRQVEKKAFMSGFESLRSTGSTGVVDLMLHPLDHTHVICGMGFGAISICDLSGTKGREKPIVWSHHASVQGVAAHPTLDAFATVGLDCLLFVWECHCDPPRKRIARSLRVGGTAVGLRGAVDGDVDAEGHVAVGYNTGAVEIFEYATLKPRFFAPARAGETVSCLRYAPSGKLLAVGSHDNLVYILDAAAKYGVRCRLRGHSSYIKNCDFSTDSRLLQSSCGAYEIMYWDMTTNLRYKASQDSIESDTKWHDWSLTLGFPVMGINGEASDGTDVNAASRSKDGKLVLVADDSGHVRIFNAPAACKWATHRAYLGHSSHCLGVVFLGHHWAVSCGGRDAAVLLWRVRPIDPLKGLEPGEDLVKPPAARPAWHEGCDLKSTVDILKKARPML